MKHLSMNHRDRDSFLKYVSDTLAIAPSNVKRRTRRQLNPDQYLDDIQVKYLRKVKLHFGTNIQKWLLNKPYVHEVTLTGQKPPLTCHQDLEILYTLRKRVDLLMLKNFWSVDQRAAKLLAVKVGVLKKKSAASAITAELCASASAWV